MNTRKYFISILLIAPFFASASFDRDLFYGLRSDPDVDELQEFLTSHGAYNGPITGNFFSLTLAGVKKFQELNGIFPAAGYFGPKTRLYVNGILSKQLSESIEQGIQESGTSTVSAVIQESSRQETANPLAILQQQIALLTAQLEELKKQNTRFTTPTGTVVDYSGNIVYQPPPPPTPTTVIYQVLPTPPAPTAVPTSVSIISPSTVGQTTIIQDVVVSTDDIQVRLNWSGAVKVKAKYTENGIVKPASISFTSPAKSQTIDTGGEATFSYTPTELGLHTITVSANGITKTMSVEAIPQFDPKIKREIIYQQDANNSSYPVEIPEYPVGYGAATIARFSLSEADEPFSISDMKFEADINLGQLNIPSNGASGGQASLSGQTPPYNYTSSAFPFIPNDDNIAYAVQIGQTTSSMIGTHTLTIKEIRIIGQRSGIYRYTQGLPIIFTFVVK